MSKAKTTRELFEALLPKYKHDHEYFHNDCGLCQWEKEEYVKVEQALAALDAEHKEKERLENLIKAINEYAYKAHSDPNVNGHDELYGIVEMSRS